MIVDAHIHLWDRVHGRLGNKKVLPLHNVYIECGGIIWLFRNEGPPFQKAQMNIRKAVGIVGAHKLMWGSDYPRTMCDFTYRQSLEFAIYGCEFFTEKEKSGFLGINAVRLYNLHRPLRKRQPRLRITEV